MFAKTLALAGLASLASAHIKMTNPVPYGASSLNNSPLKPDGSDFPCKLRSGTFELEGASNVYAQGSEQKLSFLGTAVHGGGSCQVSVTTDKNPTANSVWKVIKSIEGGCPASNAVGNIGNDANSPVPDTYPFTIPSELPAGDYALAWTWFNKIGQREMYMNCAPLTVTGSSGDANFLASLPDMFTANIGNGCATVEGTDTQFPNPGDSVDKYNAAGGTDVFGPPSGACATGTTQPDPVESDPATQPTTTPAPSPQPTEVITNPVDTVAPVDPVPVEPTSVVSVPVATPTGTPSTGTPSDGTPSTGTPTGGYAAGTACTDEGAWNCVGGSSFQRCASGAWTTLLAMAQGTTCKEGESSTLSFTKYRRSSRIMF